MKNLSKKGFTLVELIVVITILAILGTIAFLNFGQYTDDAKDAKVTSDVSQIVQKIAASTAKDLNLSDVVTDVAAYDVAGDVNSWATIGATGVSYNAGTVNYAKLGIKESDFKFTDKDGAAQPYVTAYVVNKDFATYEVAGNILDKAGNPKVVLKGTYYKVDSGDVAGLINSRDTTPAIVTDGSANALSN